MLTICLWVLAIILVFGIIRIIFRPFNGVGDMFLDIFFLDVLGDLLDHVIDALGDSDWS